MPKDRSSRVASTESCRSRASPYYLSHGRNSSRRSEESSAAAAASAAKQAAEWEEVRCPVCMDHPHNAVLLVCSSHDKGCRPFMCDTSSRHSNCLDQYRKASKESSKDSGGAASAAATECSECLQQVKLSCPLCRGPVSHWIKDYDARRHMNSKVRSCTMESCEFRGAYHELRKHARVEHPAARPMEVDPERQRDWRRMEQQRDIGDLMSMLRAGLTSSFEDVGLGAGEEGEEEVTEGAPHRHQTFTMIFIVRSSNSIEQLVSGRRRTIYLLSQALGLSPAEASSAGGANGTGPDSEEGDNPGPTTEASTSSQHEDEEEADSQPEQ